MNICPEDGIVAAMESEQTAAWGADAWVRTVLDGAPFVVLATDLDGVIRYCGGAVRRQLDFTPEELIGQSPLQLMQPGELQLRAQTLSQDLGRTIEPGWEALTARALQGQADDFDWTARRRDGGQFVGRLTVTAVRGAAGDLTGFTLVARDVSNQRRVEQALRESEERFRGAFDHSAVGMVLVSPDGFWLQANPAFCKMLGYTEDELRRMTFVDVSHPDDVDISITRDGELLGGACENYRLLKRYVRKDGGIVWTILNASLVRGPDRRPLHFVAQILDVTAQRQAEEALRESEERFRDLFENASDLIQCVDPDGRLIYVNRAWREKLGYAEDEVAKLTLADVIDQGHLAHCQEVFRQLMEGESAVTIETRFRGRDGRTLVVDGNISCGQRDGKPAYTRGIFRDVTERRAFEVLLDEYRHSLEVTNHKLAEANARLEELAATDALTGLKNRLVLQQRLEEEFQRAKRYNVPLALVLLDVDRFKLFNDTFGHPAGDVVLRQVARTLCQNARTTDLVARFGGEEFAVLLPSTDAEGAVALAERFREAIAAGPWDRRRVTASFGVAAWGPELADPANLVSAADAALYKAKQSGRNRVECRDLKNLDETVEIVVRPQQSALKNPRPPGG